MTPNFGLGSDIRSSNSRILLEQVTPQSMDQGAIIPSIRTSGRGQHFSNLSRMKVSTNHVQVPEVHDVSGRTVVSMNMHAEELTHADADTIQSKNGYCDMINSVDELFLCSGTCGRSFHLSCVNVYQIGLDWKCNECAYNTNRSIPSAPCQLATIEHIFLG